MPEAPTLMISRQAMAMIMMVIKNPFTGIWFVRNMCASF